MKIFKILVWVIMVLIVLIGSIWWNQERIDPFNASDREEVQQTANYPVTVSNYDTAGNVREVVFCQKPQRVVANEVNNVEALLALGEGDKLVLTSIHRDSRHYEYLKERYPEEFSKIHSIFEYELNKETVISMNPDLILGWKSTFTPQFLGTTEWWGEKGVNTYMVPTSNHLLKKSTLDDEYRFIMDIGRIFDKVDRAKEFVDRAKEKINLIQNQVKAFKKQKVAVIEIGGKGIYNYDSGWVIGDMVEKMGGYMPITGKNLSIEELLKEDPDVIFCVYYKEDMKRDIEAFINDSKVSSLQAVKKHRIYPILLEYMYSPGIRVVDGIELVKNALYPELGEEIN